MSVTRLQDLLNDASGTALDKVVRRARDMVGLCQMLREELPEPLRPGLVAANLRDDGELVLICRSPSWAARLRFESGSLLAAARRRDARAARCSVKVGHHRQSEEP